MYTTNTKLKNNQAGLVSIIVTVVMMIVISLMVVGFAKIIRREQRQALDRQLSTQAFYAAEAGINQARKAIELGYTSSKTNCDPIPPPDTPATAIINDSVLDADSGTQITCLLINPSPDSLWYPSVTSAARVVPLISESGTGFTSIKLTWQNKNTSTPAAYGCSHPNFPASTAWGCSVGILRVELVPTVASAASPLDRELLNRNMYSVFLYPGTSGATDVTYLNANAGGRADQGEIIQTKCNGSPPDPAVCSMEIKITGLGLPSYHMRVRSLYADSSLLIEGKNGGSTLSFKDAQTLVDSTGKASDILRRIQVRICTSPLCQDAPEYVVQTSDICKLYVVAEVVTDGCASGPPPPAGAGNASFGDTCSTCPPNPGSGTPALPFRHTFFNTSTNDPSIVAGCTWSWGDGNKTDNQACYRDNRITHDYPTDPSPKCYTVVLTIRFNNGYPDANYPGRRSVPRGGSSAC